MFFHEAQRNTSPKSPQSTYHPQQIKWIYLELNAIEVNYNILSFKNFLITRF